MSKKHFPAWHLFVQSSNLFISGFKNEISANMILHFFSYKHIISQENIEIPRKDDGCDPLLLHDHRRIGM